MKLSNVARQCVTPPGLKRIKILGLTFFILVSAFLSGCITIYEKFRFNSNGSGTMEYLIDMSEFYTIMQSFSDKQPNEDLMIDQSFMDAADRLKTIRGISNIQLTGNINEYIFGIKYDFANPNALNDAMSYIFQKNTNHKEYLSFKRKIITRHSVISDEFSRDKIIGKDEKELDEGMMTEIFEKMKYNISMEFSRPVRSVDTKAEYTIDNKKLTLETDFGKIMDDNKILETTIRLK